ncbi:hypothetical protein Q31b_36300 [Novipirellula aureliae]|uniref:Uncharacterized protein n=1 Tax=Novipirellula aureliae TaxID=2527966 RepID=A0A5C6DSG4_9BACT|nr:hypothetical protein [Novipirellula aureliae]TWU40283.1 hypothetical protein Q31b_36300 [Novipirellula aureliae]
MSSEESVASSIGEMVSFFIPHCEDLSTLYELKSMAADSTKWRKAHDLFDRIRNKTLCADKTNDRMLQHQYSFEEICAKTLYNLSGYPAPFDDDSPFWVIPIAVAFAQQLGVDDPCCVSSLLRPPASTQ